MSWWCEKCQMLNYGGDKCLGCGHVKDKGNSGARVSNFNEYENEKTITLNKQSVIMVAVIIIAISISYLAINQYKENREKEKAIEYITGSSDPEKYENATYEERKKMMENSQMNKDMKIMWKDTEKSLDNIFKNQ